VFLIESWWGEGVTPIPLTSPSTPQSFHSQHKSAQWQLGLSL